MTKKYPAVISSTRHLARIFHEFTPWRDCHHGYGRPSWRPQVFLRQAQDKLTLRRTVQVRLGTNPAGRLPGGTPIFAVWRQQFMK